MKQEDLISKLEEKNRWWTTGFPAAEIATKRQQYYIRGQWKNVSILIDTDELCMIELMTLAEWLKLLPKRRASELISAVKSGAHKKKRDDEAGRSPLLKASMGICPRCQRPMGEMKWGYRCPLCGEEIIRIKQS